MNTPASPSQSSHDEASQNIALAFFIPEVISQTDGRNASGFLPWATERIQTLSFEIGLAGQASCRTSDGMGVILWPDRYHETKRVFFFAFAERGNKIAVGCDRDLIEAAAVAIRVLEAHGHNTDGLPIESNAKKREVERSHDLQERAKQGMIFMRGLVEGRLSEFPAFN